MNAGRRVTARHVKILKDSGESKVTFPIEHLIDKVVAKKVLNEETGEIILDSNHTIDEETIALLAETKISTLESAFISMS